MKKFLSFAISLACIALVMTGCPTPVEPQPDPNNGNQENPDTGGYTPLAQNYIFDYVNVVKDLLGQNKDVAKSKITASVWQEVPGAPGVYMFAAEHYCSELHVTANEAGVVYTMTMSVYPNRNEGHVPMIDANYVKDAVTKFSNEITIETDHTCRFYAAYNQVGAIWAKNPNEFAKYMSDENLNASKTVWLDNSLGRFDSDDKSRFIGMILVCNRYQVEGCSTQEYNVAIELTDNQIINPD